MSFFIVNKTDNIQRTTVYGNKQDIKPGEIVEVKEDEGLYITKAYGDIFGVSKEAEERKAPKKKTKKITTK